MGEIWANPKCERFEIVPCVSILFIRPREMVMKNLEC